MPVAVTSITEGGEPNGYVAQGEAVQVPGAAVGDLLGLGSEKPGELPLEAQPRVLLNDAVADCIGYLGRPGARPGLTPERLARGRVAS